MSFRIVTVGLLAVVLGACAAASKKPRQASDPDVFEATDKGAASTSEDTGSDLGKSMAAHEQDYLQTCVKGAEYQAYCECAWGIYNSTINLGEMNKGNISQAKLDQVQQKSAQVCGARMPEAMVKDAFVGSCSRDGFKAFCECMWPPLRKRFAPEELADRAVLRSDRFTDVARGVARGCGHKVQEAELKRAFVGSCVERGGAQGDKFCQCTWTELRKGLSPAEIELAIVAGTIDIHKGQERIHRACDKLKAD
jgi:hypothetical protein